MNGHVAYRTRYRRTIIGLGFPLLLLVGGCEPISAEVLQAFLVDFARSAAAAWLL